MKLATVGDGGEMGAGADVISTGDGKKGMAGRDTVMCIMRRGRAGSMSSFLYRCFSVDLVVEMRRGTALRGERVL